MVSDEGRAVQERVVLLCRREGVTSREEEEETQKCR